ncbi:MAG: Lrp/AsnC family transcriptional regulator [Pseudomonadota bacterium]|nr:Lrp/AsnC family transcriptional regulator [Pseudomonadota bacterium]
MRRPKLDPLDRKILKMLQDNGRMTNVELAQNLGLSAPPCLRRVRALEESGYIRGYHARLNASALGYTLTVFTLVSLSSHADADLQHFSTLVESWPQVVECYMLAGDYDFLLKVVAKNWDEYQDFLTTTLTAAPNIAHVKSTMTVRKTKFVTGVPVPMDETADTGK